jgi:hypothetical protein
VRAAPVLAAMRVAGGDDPEVAEKLRIEERELECGRAELAARIEQLLSDPANHPPGER